MSAVPEHYLTLQDYLQLEETSETKHEYYQGAIYDLAGANMRHNIIVANVIGNLYMQLREKKCTVVPSDLRIKVEAIGLYTYPDVSVICGEIGYADGRQDTVTNPSLIIEVLSPSSENYDCGLKFQHYRTLASLQEYLLIAQDRARVELYVRQQEHQWLLMEFTGIDQVIPLTSIGCSLTLTAIYEKIGFDAQDEKP